MYDGAAAEVTSTAQQQDPRSALAQRQPLAAIYEMVCFKGESSVSPVNDELHLFSFRK